MSRHEIVLEQNIREAASSKAIRNTDAKPTVEGLEDERSFNDTFI